MADNKTTPTPAPTPILLTDKTGETRKGLDKILEYWKDKTQIELTKTAIVRALVKRYERLLEQDEPNRLDLDKIF